MESEKRPVRGERLEGWAAIADHLSVSVKTAQNWARKLGLPVCKQQGARGGRVYGFAEELTAWVESRSVRLGEAPAKEAGGRRWLRARAVAAAGAAVSMLVAGYLLAVHRLERKPPAGAGGKITAGRMLWRVNAEGGTVKRIELPLKPTQVAVSPDGSRIYAIEDGHRELAVVQESSGRVRLAALPGGVQAMAVSPADGRVYLGSVSDGVIAVDAARGKVVKTWRAGGAVRDLAVQPDGSQLFAAMRQRGVKRLDLETGEWSSVTEVPCPHFLSLDGGRRRLLVSYQCGGPGGRDGHDAIEIFDLPEGRSVETFSGPPLVGGRHAFSPAGNLIWLDGWDACSTESYDRQGCKKAPSHVYHVYEPVTKRVIKQVELPFDAGGSPVFYPGGDRVLLTGFTVVDALTGAVRERRMAQYAYPSAVFAPDGRRVYLAAMDERAVLALDIEPEECALPELGLAHFLPFDGGAADLADNGELMSGAQYAPGLVGRALSLMGAGARTEWRKSSSLQLGRDDSTMAFHLRLEEMPGEEVPLLEQMDSGERIGWRISLTPGGEIAVRLRPSETRVIDAKTAPFVRRPEWRHVVVTLSDAGLKIYGNGRLLAELEGLGDRASRNFGTPNRVRIGWSGGLRARGLIDELAVWARALGAQEIEGMHRRRQSPACKP